MADMVKYPDFVQDGQLTPDGSHLLEFMHAQFEEADQSSDVNRLNSLHGPVSEYYTLVYKLGLKTPAGWMATMPQSARNAYDLMKYVESVAEREAQTEQIVDKTSEIAQQLETFKESIAEEMSQMRGEIERLTAENQKLSESKAPAKKAAKKRGASEDETPGDGDAVDSDTEVDAE